MSYAGSRERTPLVPGPELQITSLDSALAEVCLKIVV